MKITCVSLLEFIECLNSETKIFQDTIRVSIVRRPIDAHEKEPVKFAVALQASAIVEVVESESQYLLQVGLSCGKDYEDGKPERVGTTVANSTKEEIVEYAKGRQWKVLPGILEE